MTALRISTSNLCKLLLGRIQDAGLKTTVTGSGFPKLPDGFKLNLEYIDADDRHDCQGHRLVHIPLVLVVDVAVPEISMGADNFRKMHIWQAHQNFAPYWLFDVSIIHDQVPYPNRPHRLLNVLEAACLFAQHSYLGSVQCHQEPRTWDYERMQVYRFPGTGEVVASRFGISEHNHHVAVAAGVFGLNSPLVIPSVLPALEKVESQSTETSVLPKPLDRDTPMNFAGSIPPD